MLYLFIVKENVKYAVRLRNYGSRTANGDGGMTTVQCPDGVTFTFSTCSLSSNGTNQTRVNALTMVNFKLPSSSCQMGAWKEMCERLLWAKWCSVGSRHRVLIRHCLPIA